jgi:hypothetical protein
MDEPHRLPFPSEQDTPWSAGAYPSECRIARPAPVSSTREKPDDQGIGLGHMGSNSGIGSPAEQVHADLRSSTRRRAISEPFGRRAKN